MEYKMLKNKDLINYDDYIELFKKKMASFLKKSPCQFDMVITPISVVFKEKKTSDILTFNFDITVDLKDFIHNIYTTFLEKYYPVMKEVIKSKIDYTLEEIQKLISKGMDVDSAILMKKEIVEERFYRIERIVMLKDRLFVRDIQTNKRYLYEIKNPPLSFFLNNIRNKWTQEYSYTVFKERATLLKEDNESNNLEDNIND